MKMWVIKMKFTNGEIYSKEEESATTEKWADVKYDRMLVRWSNILCQNRYIKELMETDDIMATEEDKRDDIYYINRSIEYLNKLDGGHRIFEISKNFIEQMDVESV